jgi:L-threonylcarbamoyladenylate synthase
VDGGQSQVGIESTVIDLTSTPPRLLRPGMIHEQTLMAVMGELSVGFGDSEEILKSPGLLKKHYAPKARLVILNWRDEVDLQKQVSAFGFPMAECHVIAHTRIPSQNEFARVSVIPHDAEAFARAIYAELHECDEAGAKLIVVEALPAATEWKAIADRLKRATAT